MRHIREIVIDTLDGYHRLSVLIDGKSLVLHTLCHDVHLWQLTNFGQDRVVTSCRLSHSRNHLQLWVEASEQSSHQVVEAIEHTQYNHQRHRSYSHTDGTDRTDDIDGVSTLLGKEIPASYEKRKVHITS